MSKYERYAKIGFIVLLPVTEYRPFTNTWGGRSKINLVSMVRAGDKALLYGVIKNVATGCPWKIEFKCWFPMAYLPIFFFFYG